MNATQASISSLARRVRDSRTTPLQVFGIAHLQTKWVWWYFDYLTQF